MSSQEEVGEKESGQKGVLKKIHVRFSEPGSWFQK